MAGRNITLYKRFWEKVDVSAGPHGCWLWIATVTNKGYGQFSKGRVSVTAHRMSWELANGVKPPTDLFVCHRCDTPTCVNPAHLFLGTHRDNIADMVAKGRGRWAGMRESSK